MNTLANSCFQYDGSDDSKNIIRIMNKNHRGNFTGNDKYFYWIANDIAYTFYKMDKDLTVIPPSDYLALLTGKQLTEGERQRDVIKDLLPTQESVESQPETVPVQEEVKWDKIIIGDNENLKCIADQIEQVFKSHLDDETRIELSAKTAYYYFKNGINQYRKWKEESKSETAHLQQQLKEAKELNETAMKYLRAFCFGVTENDTTGKIETSLTGYDMEDILHFIMKNDTPTK